MRQSQAQLIQEQQLTASLESRLTETGVTQLQVSSQLSATQSQVQQLQQSLQDRQKEFQSLEKERAKIEHEAGGVAASLMAVEAELVDTQLLLTDTEKAAAALKSKLELTDQDRSETQKQLVDARTGIRNLRNRLDESEADLKRTRVQSSLQVCSGCASVCCNHMFDLCSAGHVFASASRQTWQNMAQHGRTWQKPDSCL